MTDKKREAIDAEIDRIMRKSRLSAKDTGKIVFYAQYYENFGSSKIADWMAVQLQKHMTQISTFSDVQEATVNNYQQLGYIVKRAEEEVENLETEICYRLQVIELSLRRLHEMITDSGSVLYNKVFQYCAEYAPKNRNDPNEVMTAYLKGIDGNIEKAAQIAIRQIVNLQSNLILVDLLSDVFELPPMKIEFDGCWIQNGIQAIQDALADVNRYVRANMQVICETDTDPILLWKNLLCADVDTLSATFVEEIRMYLDVLKTMNHAQIFAQKIYQIQDEIKSEVRRSNGIQ